jgi:predicted acylesterase/phospholipase RssA
VLGEPQDPGSPPADRRKLGLALAGGGFRASLFHLGVLHRLAQMDLLRRVEVLSTVSGGSVIGALYMLLLKRERLLDRVTRMPVTGEPRRLTRDEYVAIVEELDRRLTHAMALNLRNALFWNPLGILRVLFTPYTLGERMASLYERYLYRGVVDDLCRAGLVADRRPFWKRRLWPGRIPLRDIRAQLPSRDLPGGIEAYNHAESRDPAGCAVTHAIINATSVNSGARFWFSSSEIGDWYLGHFRHSEAKLLHSYRSLLRSLAAPGARTPRSYRSLWRSRLAFDFVPTATGPDRVTVGAETYDRRTVLLALWLRDRAGLADAVKQHGDWSALFTACDPGALAEADFGRLRLAKLPAWYLRVGARRTPQVLDGATEQEQEDRFWSAIQKIDQGLAARLKEFAQAPEHFKLLLDFVLELYWLRSAEVAGPKLEEEMDRLTVGLAVGASACFPPVFSPITQFGLYDDAHVARLGLTDGGVFDNMGIIALVDEGCDYIITSDTGGVFEQQQSATATRLGLAARLASILMKDLGSEQRTMLRERSRVSDQADVISAAHDRLRDRLRAADFAVADLDALRRSCEEFDSTRKLRGLACFEIASRRTGIGLEMDRAALAEMRTDLDGFGEAEIAALVLAGYDTADLYVRRYLAAFKPKDSDDLWNAPLVPPRPMPDTRKINHVIEVSKHRFFRSLRFVGWWALVPWISTLVGAVAAGYGLYQARGSVGAVLAGLPDTVQRLTVWDGWAAIPAGWAVLGAVGMAVLAWLIGLAAKRSRVLRRWHGWLGKWALGFSGLAIFFFGWKPAAAIVAVLFSYAWVNWLLYHFPFRRLTSIERVVRGSGRAAPAP